MKQRVAHHKKIRCTITFILAMMLFLCGSLLVCFANAEHTQGHSGFLHFNLFEAYGFEECHSAFLLPDNMVFIAGSMIEVETDGVDPSVGVGLLVDNAGTVKREIRFQNTSVIESMHLLGGAGNDGFLLLIAHDAASGHASLLHVSEDGTNAQYSDLSTNANISVRSVIPADDGVLVCGQANKYGRSYPWASLLDFQGNSIWEYADTEAFGSAFTQIQANKTQGFYLLAMQENRVEIDPYTLVELNQEGILTKKTPLILRSDDDQDIVVRHMLVDQDQIILSGSNRVFGTTIRNNSYIIAINDSGKLDWQREHASYGTIQTAIAIDGGYIFGCIAQDIMPGRCLFFTDKQGNLPEQNYADARYSCWPKLLMWNDLGEMVLVGNHTEARTGLPDIFFAKIDIEFASRVLSR